MKKNMLNVSDSDIEEYTALKNWIKTNIPWGCLTSVMYDLNISTSYYYSAINRKTYAQLTKKNKLFIQKVIEYINENPKN